MINSISGLGRVVGMVMEIPQEIKNHTEFDKLDMAGLSIEISHSNHKGAFRQDETVIATKVEAVGHDYFAV